MRSSIAARSPRRAAVLRRCDTSLRLRRAVAFRRAATTTALALVSLLPGCLPGQASGTRSDSSAADSLRIGSGSYVFDGTEATRTRPVRVHYHRPAGITADSPIFIVMHGAGRNGGFYRDAWAGLAERHRFLLIAPEFSQAHYPGAALYNLGGLLNGDGEPTPPELWAYTTIEDIFDDVRARAGSATHTYLLYGHSAGAQFVHRLVTLLPEARYDVAMAANAGWYTMPVTDVPFPYGLEGVQEILRRPASELLENAFRRRVIILLGARDVDPQDSSLRRDVGANAQGAHRFARGQRYFAAARAEAQARGIELNWEIHVVPGVAHDNRGMAPAAIEALGWTRAAKSR